MILDATPTQLGKIDAVLLGKDAVAGNRVFESKKTYSVTQAADELGISRKSVYKLVKEARLKIIPFGNHFRISDQAIRDYLLQAG